MLPDWFWYTVVFAFGSCIGSFLNVVIYRLPLGISLVTPPSTCPSCNKQIKFYHNIPILSWLLLMGKCRYCKARISPRYLFIELLTGLIFLSLFYLYFTKGVVSGMEALFPHGWYIYLLHLIFLSCLIAASGIDMERWIIPISICLIITATGVVFSSFGWLVADPRIITGYHLLPNASGIFMRSSTLVSLTVGAVAGLCVSLGLLWTGKIKPSYVWDEDVDGNQAADVAPSVHRKEMLKETVFLLPIIVGAAISYFLCTKVAVVAGFWVNAAANPIFSGFMGSLWGYLVGGGLVWLVRILGTLGFGKEAMGLGDVHLMAGAGAVLGAWPVVAAFFVAPFFGLGWAVIQMFSKKIHQIPYGPFLSAGLFAVMILHDRIFDYLNTISFR